MSARQDWDKARRNPRGYEEASPKGPEPTRGGSHVKPGKVRTWAEMTPAERAEVEAATKRK